MIASISGKLIFKSMEYIIIEVSGIGYQLFIPLSTFYGLPEIGRDIRLITYTYVREDTFQLYGFLSNEEKRFFQMLIKIPGIGPKLAINILSGIPPDELEKAIVSSDVRKIKSIPGIGKKTAERVIVDLRDKIIKTGKFEPSSNIMGKNINENVLSDALSALVNLGFKKNEAEKVLEKVLSSGLNNPNLELVIKESLKVLYK